MVFPGFHLLLNEVHQFKKNARIVIQENDYVQIIHMLGKAFGLLSKFDQPIRERILPKKLYQALPAQIANYK